MIYLATDNVILATAVAIAGAIGQVIWSRIKGQTLGYMTWASLGLVIVLGGATLLTHDPRFVLAKPAIGHFAIGLIMLKRGWMLRYMPPIVTETIPEYVTFAGYAWAALMFVLAAGTIAVAMTGDMKLWTFYVSVVLIGAKVVAFAHPVCRVPHAGRQPHPCRRPRLIHAYRVRADNRVKKAATDRWACAMDRLYRRAHTRISVGRSKWPWTETGISS